MKAEVEQFGPRENLPLADVFTICDVDTLPCVGNDVPDMEDRCGNRAAFEVLSIRSTFKHGIFFCLPCAIDYLRWIVKQHKDQPKRSKTYVSE